MEHTSAAVPEIDQPEFATNDHELTSLLNIVAELAKGNGSMDLGIYFVEMLERAMYAKDGKELIAANKELRAIRAQPAEAEGAVEAGSDAWMALHLLDRLDVDSDDELRVQQIEEIVRRMGAAMDAKGGDFVKHKVMGWAKDGEQ